MKVRVKYTPENQPLNRAYLVQIRWHWFSPWRTLSAYLEMQPAIDQAVKIAQLTRNPVVWHS